MATIDYPLVLVVRTDEISLATKSRGSEDKRVVLLVVTVPIAISIVAGLRGWRLVRPGRSLFGPIAEVALLEILPCAIVMAALSLSNNRQLHRLCIGMFAVLGGIAIIWTYFGVLPASVAWNSSGPHLAATTPPGSHGQCQLVTSGSIGFIGAPYKVCLNDFNGAASVRFTTGDLTSGYAYLTATQPSPAEWFPSECSQHLIGDWWAYTGLSPSSGCPFGYASHGAA